MELSDAIERVEGGELRCSGGEELPCPSCKANAQALALVLEAAKRPGFTAEDAKWLKEQINPKQYYRSDQDKADAFRAKLDAYLEGLKGQSESTIPGE